MFLQCNLTPLCVFDQKNKRQEKQYSPTFVLEYITETLKRDYPYLTKYALVMKRVGVQN